MTTIDTFHIGEAVEDIRDIRDRLAAVVELMVGDQAEYHSAGLLNRLASLFKLSLDEQEDAINKIYSLIEKASASDEPQAEALENEKSKPDHSNSDLNRSEGICQGHTMNDLIGKEIRNIYCNLFNLSTDLKDTIPQLEKIEKMAVLRNDPETSDVCNIAIDCVRDKMKFLSSGIRINGHRLKEMVD